MYVGNRYGWLVCVIVGFDTHILLDVCMYGWGGHQDPPGRPVLKDSFSRLCAK